MYTLKLIPKIAFTLLLFSANLDVNGQSETDLENQILQLLNKGQACSNYYEDENEYKEVVKHHTEIFSFEIQNGNLVQHKQSNETTRSTFVVVFDSYKHYEQVVTLPIMYYDKLEVMSDSTLGIWTYINGSVISREFNETLIFPDSEFKSDENQADFVEYFKGMTVISNSLANSEDDIAKLNQLMSQLSSLYKKL